MHFILRNKANYFWGVLRNNYFTQKIRFEIQYEVINALKTDKRIASVIIVDSRASDLKDIETKMLKFLTVFDDRIPSK